MSVSFWKLIQAYPLQARPAARKYQTNTTLEPVQVSSHTRATMLLVVTKRTSRMIRQ